MNEDFDRQNITALDLSLNNSIVSDATIDDIIGKKINMAPDGSIPSEEWKRLTDYLSIYSDKRYETARFLFIKDGEIIDQVLTSSGIPTTTFPYPSNEFLAKYESYARKTESRIVFIHNHPSGIVLPSDADKDFTKMLSSYMKNIFCGHIILDHGSSGIYLNNSDKWIFNVDGKFLDEASYINTGAKRTYLSNIQNYVTSDEKDLNLAINLVKKLDAGLQWHMKGFTSCVFLRENNLVESIHFINDSEFYNHKALSQKLKEIGWSDGASKLILFPTSREQYREAVIFNNKEKIVFDILNPDAAEISFRNKKVKEKSYNPPANRLFNSNDARKIFKYEATAPILNLNGVSYNIDIKKKLMDSTYKNLKEIKGDLPSMSNYIELIDEKTKKLFSKTERTEEQQKKIEKLFDSVKFRPGSTTGQDSEFSRMQDYFNAFENPDELIKLLEVGKDMGNALIDANGMANLVAEYISREAGLTPCYKEGAFIKLSEEQYEQEKSLRSLINLYGFNIVNGNNDYLEANRISNPSQLFKRLYEINENILEDKTVYDSKRQERLNDFINENHFDSVEIDEWSKICSDPRFENITPGLFSLIDRYNIKPDCISLYEIFNRIELAIQKEYEKNLNHASSNEFNMLRGQFLQFLDYYKQTYHVRSNFINKLQSDKIRAFFDFDNNPGMEYLYLKQIKNLDENYQLENGEKLVFENMALAYLKQPVVHGKFAGVTDNVESFNEAALFSILEISRNLFDDKEIFLKDGNQDVPIKNIYDLKSYIDSEPQRTNDDYGWLNSNFQVDNALNRFNRSTKELRTKGLMRDQLDSVVKEIQSGNINVINSVELLNKDEFNPKSNDYNEEKLMEMLNDELLSDKNVKKNLYKNEIIEKIKTAGIEVITNKDSQFMTLKEGSTYGFVHNGKIYLNPDIINSNAAVHEYTHLWDVYTQKTNPELWGNGLKVFKDTKYWYEVINDPNYQNIKDDENLVLSEIHSRLTGDFAEKVLDRISELDGEQKKLESIDWNKETWNYIYNELNLNLEHSYDENGKYSYSDVAEFLSMPMKDLIASKNISIEAGQSVETVQAYTSIEEFNNSLTPQNENLGKEIDVTPNFEEITDSEANYTEETAPSQEASFTISDNFGEEKTVETSFAQKEDPTEPIQEEIPEEKQVEKKSEKNSNKKKKLSVKEFLEGAMLCTTMDEYEAYYERNYNFINLKVIKKGNQWQIQEKETGKDILVPLNNRNEADAICIAYCKENPSYQINIPTPETLKKTGGIKELNNFIKDYEENFQETLIKPEKKEQVSFNPNDIKDEKVKKVFGVVDIDLVKKFVETKESPYIKGTPVPDFGTMTQDNVRTINSGWYFCEESKKDGSVILERYHNGIYEMMKVECTAYQNIINRSKEFTQSLTEDKTLQKRIEDYYKYQDSIKSGDRQIRQNTADQFWHNFEVMCYQKASNEQDVMEIVKEIYLDMPKAQKDRIKKIEAEYKQKTGDTFEKRIYRKYNEILKERKLELQHKEMLVNAEIESKIKELDNIDIDKVYRAAIIQEEIKRSRLLTKDEMKSVAINVITNDLRAKNNIDPANIHSYDPGIRATGVAKTYDVNYGGKVDDSLSVKIGDTIKYKGIKVERFPGASTFFTKKVRILPVKEYKVRAVSKELGIITLENNNGSIYRLSLDEFIKTRAVTEKRLEKAQVKEQKKQKAKDDYYYER